MPWVRIPSPCKARPFFKGGNTAVQPLILFSEPPVFQKELVILFFEPPVFQKEPVRLFLIHLPAARFRDGPGTFGFFDPLTEQGG